MNSTWIGSVLTAVTGVTLLAAPSALAGPVLVDRMETWAPAGLPVADPSAVAPGPGSSIFIADASSWKGEPLPQFNLWEIDRSTQQVIRSFDLRFSREPAGISYHAGSDTLFITDDDKLELSEVARDGSRLRVIDLEDLGARDPEGVSVDVEGNRIFVADGRGGQILVLSTSGELIRTLSFEQHGFENAEGIAYDPGTRHLYLVTGKTRTLVEMDQEGALVGAYDLAALGIVAPEGLAIAPEKSSHPASIGPRLWIADELVHKQADGRIVEIELVRRPENSRVSTSMVGDEDGFGFSGEEPGFAASDRDRDGRLEVGERLPDRALTKRPRPDHRDPEDARATDTLLEITDGAPISLTHEISLASAEPVWARLTVVIADARATALNRSQVLADGVLVGEIIGARGRRLVPGAIVQTTVELPSRALEQLKDGRLVVEIARPPGTGSDEMWIDYSRLDVAVAR